MSTEQGHIFVISAPSGAGKTSIMRPFLKRHPEFVFSVSATTRKRRPGEREGIDYHYISSDEFEKKIVAREFLEWEQVYDYYYGTPKKNIDDSIPNGKHIFIEVEVKGALSIKKIYSNAVLIFIEPPSYEELQKRLVKRKTENEEDLTKRLDRAKMELEQKPHFDFCIVNHQIEPAIENLEKYINKIITKGVI